jgi:tRNA dimethylallyltransferase
MIQNSLPPLVVILGETATGKTSLAFDLAKRMNGEIICADSWTVRREVNIGTDKPTKKQQEEIEHHLINIVDPCQDFTAAVFKNLALFAIEDIYSRGKLPIMVGGSGLYIDSVIFNYKFLKAGDRKQRERLNDLSTDELIQKIHQLNIPLRNNIDLNNKRRLIRVIESGGQVPKKSKLRENTLNVGLYLDKESHKKAIVDRVNQMILEGLEQEVKNLSLNYGWNCEALKGVGYKQWEKYFNGQQSLADTQLQIVSATNNLAKKQRTWFQRNKSIHWLMQPVCIDEVVDLVTTNLSI